VIPNQARSVAQNGLFSVQGQLLCGLFCNWANASLSQEMRFTQPEICGSIPKFSWIHGQQPFSPKSMEIEHPSGDCKWSPIRGSSKFAPFNGQTIAQLHGPVHGSKFELSADLESGLAICCPTCTCFFSYDPASDLSIFGILDA
jgi:hypothetical protein